MNTTISIQNVSKQYAHHKALDKISIDIEEGAIYGLLGPNGAGKTSLIRILNQITGPDEGAIYINNERLHPKHTAIIGYLPEERGLYKKMKVGEQALYLAQLKGLTKADATKKLVYWFKKFEIENWWERKVEELSKGMQQKVQFITTILHEPKILIFDEPFTGFDPINVQLLKQEILHLKNNGATLLLSTHNMESVEELCDKITLIHQSKKILDGSIHDIKQQYKQNVYHIQIDQLQNPLESIIPSSFKITAQQQTNQTLQANIELPSQTDSNELIRILLQHGTISGFKELLPSMNEVFIKAVSQKNHE